jgi:WS/DGAT/MGAT family acyltransferase
VAAALYDLTPDAVEVSEPPPFRPDSVPSAAEIVGRNALNALGLPLRAAQLGRDLLERGAASVPYALGKQRPAMPFQAPRTPFNGQLTPHRGFAAASLDIELVKDVKNAAGVKVNDVVLAVCGGALRAFLDDLGELPDKPLVAQVPVSTRTDVSRAEVGTKVGSMFVSLGTDIADPLARLKVVRKSATAAKRLRGALAEHQRLGLSDAIPPGLFTVAARTWSFAHLDDRSPPIYNVIISNVAGPPFDFYVAGARIEKMYPMGPLLYGGGLNITVFSNGGTLDVGLVTCSDLVPDPWPLADGFEPALEELAGAVFDAAPLDGEVRP